MSWSGDSDKERIHKSLKDPTWRRTHYPETNLSILCYLFAMPFPCPCLSGFVCWIRISFLLQWLLNSACQGLIHRRLWQLVCTYLLAFHPLGGAGCASSSLNQSTLLCTWLLNWYHSSSSSVVVHPSLSSVSSSSPVQVQKLNQIPFPIPSHSNKKRSCIGPSMKSCSLLLPFQSSCLFLISCIPVPVLLSSPQLLLMRNYIPWIKPPWPSLLPSLSVVRPSGLLW